MWGARFIPPFFWKLLNRVAVEPFKPQTKPMLITADQLRKICTSMNSKRAGEIAALLNELGEKYGVQNTDEFDEFLANLAQESLEFQHKTENMYYQAATIMKVWPSRFKTLSAAMSYAKAPEKLANNVYHGRMGNNQPGDGWRFRGGGFIGLTGREMYTKYAAYLKKPVEETADLVRTTDRYALDSAFWFFYVLKGLKDESVRDEFVGIVRSINGGLIGLKDRQFYYDRVKKYLV